jgi:serine/threonine protein kinase
MPKSNSSNSDYSDYSDSTDDDINWESHVINNQYLILNKLGEGSYCTVWNVYDVTNKRYIAFKIYNTEDTDDALEEKKIMDNIRKFKIDDIVLYEKSFIYKYNEDEYIIDIMPQYGYSLNDIKKLFRDHIYLPENQHIFNKYVEFIHRTHDKLTNILNIMHSNNIAHTDIKPENILIDIQRLDTLILIEQIKDLHNKLKKKYNNNKLINILKDNSKQFIEKLSISQQDICNYLNEFNFNIKLCDMGTTLEFNSEQIYKKHTSYYKSPHIILKYPLDRKYDFWSLGCTLYELITSTVLFDPFEENLVEKYDDIEDLNLMYLITSTIGLPPDDIMTNSKVRDIYFSFDKKNIRFYNKLIFNPFIQNILELTNDINKHHMHELLNAITHYIHY